MAISIEQLPLDELQTFLHEQAEEAFPDLKDEQRLETLSRKWHLYAEFCTCRSDGGCLIGMVAFYANQPKEGICYIPHIYVSPIFRGKGFFKQMLDYVVDYVRAKGFKEIKLEVHNDNNRAISVYKKLGFVESGKKGSFSVFMKKDIVDVDNK